MSARGIMPMALVIAGRTAPRASAATPLAALVTFALLYYVVMRR